MKRLCNVLIFLCLYASAAFAVQVNINFYADGQKIHTEKVESGNTYTLSTILSNAGISVSGCRGYNFIGWKEEGPVEGDETPTRVTTVTPDANVNLYAVYQRTGADANRYTRITSTSELQAGSQYLIVCYYEWDGDVYYGPSYFALGNTQEAGTDGYWWTVGDTYTPSGGWGTPCRNTSCDVYTKKYSISASQVYPDAGTIANPANTIIWTLSGSEGAWKWTNGTGATAKSLYIRRGFGQKYYLCNDNLYTITGQSYGEELLTAAGNTCSVTAANGEFNFESAGYYLTYSNDENDYFQTATSNDWTFYLYKKESEYTSFPNCSNWIVHLDALDGTIVGTSPAASTTDVSETSSGSGVTLPNATMADAACSSWAFAGWNPESPIYGTTNAPTLQTGTYNPPYNGTTLYAVYQAGENDTYWERITNWDELQNGDVCVVATTGGRAVNTTYTSGFGGNYFGSSTITVSGRRLAAEPASGIQWTWSGSYFYSGSTTLSDNSSRTGNYVYKGSGSEPFVLDEYNYSGYYLYLNNQNRFVESTNSTQFYIYKKITTYATYSSYPHCTPYSVTLNVAGGKFEDTGSRESRIVSEVTAGGGVTLPNVLPLCPDDGWEFVGWQEGSEVGSVKDVDYTGLYTDSYAPSRDGVTLYAVFKRRINTFRILNQPEEMVTGDNYLITAYDGTYDYEISSAKYSDNYLSGVQAAAPQGGEGYYIEVDTTAVGWKNALWTMAGTYSNCTFLNVGNGEYLTSTTGGYTRTANTGTSYTVARPTANFYFTIKHSANNYYINYNTTNNYFSTSTSAGNYMFVYRQMKEYTSWPHCDPFTVNFDGCGGTAGETSLTESAAYAGITLPNAYANSDCSKEGWIFAGWATEPVSEESNSLPMDVLPAGTHYSPTVNGGTLYAVYQQKQNTFKRISSLSDLRIGLNYIIATSSNALSNTAQNTNYVASKAVTPASNIITTDDADIQWRIQGVRGAYEFYNTANNKYLDLSTEGYALLKDNADDNFVISVSSGVFYVRSIMALSNTKYLGYTSNYFNTVESANVPTIYFYQQQATYHSYPSCVEAVEALRWDENYVYVESYTLSDAPDMNKSIGDPVSQTDGTWQIAYNEALTPCSKVTVNWDGEISKVKVPYVVSANSNSSSLLTLPDCSECDLVVLSGKTLTVNSNVTLHNLTIYEGGTLHINNNVTLTVHSLTLRIDGDESKAPEVQFGGANANLVVELGEIYLDRRLDEEDYYWFTLPYDAQVQEISYSNLASNGNVAPVYRQDFFLKYYDGAKRASDINAGNRADTYWTHVAAKGSDYTLNAGQGYIIGIANQKNKTQADGRKHTKRVLRITMKPASNWNAQERGTGKTAPISASTIDDENLAYNAGWNLIGNPYMHTYSTGSVGSNSGLKNGFWEQELNDQGKWTGQWVPTDGSENVPYLTLYNRSTGSYEQVLAQNHDIKPFTAVFVQVEEGDKVNFTSPMAVNRMPAYMRFMQEETPVYTGITLSGEAGKDQTGIVLADHYTPAYEVGADLYKWENKGKVNLYTLIEDKALAFMALADNDASNIPVGINLPAAGNYTISFDLQYSPLLIDTLLLTDHLTGITTNLLLEDYSFNTEAGVNNSRFTLNCKRSRQSQEEEVPTDLNAISNELYCTGVQDGILLKSEQPAEVRIFDSTGKQVIHSVGVQGMQHFALQTGVYNLYITQQNKQTTLRAIVK